MRNNKIIDNGVKILYLNDDPYFNDRPTDSFNMDFDFSGLNENDITKAQDKFRDVYSSIYNPSMCYGNILFYSFHEQKELYNSILHNEFSSNRSRKFICF
jgi:hypothetical protein